MIDRPSLTYGLGQLESICAASKLLVSESAGFGCVPAMCASRVSHKHLDSHLSPLLLELKKKKKKIMTKKEPAVQQAILLRRGNQL